MPSTGGSTVGDVAGNDIVSSMVARECCLQRDKYAAGKPRSREIPERVREIQTALVRIIRYDRQGLSQRAIAYAIWHEYEQYQIRRPLRSSREKPPGNLIPRFETRLDLGEVRADCERYLRETRRGQTITSADVAREVASRFTEHDARAAVRKIQRIVAEAKAYEYVHHGVNVDNYFHGDELVLQVRTRQSTKRPLPPPRSA
jgi:hypothetical protein